MAILWSILTLFVCVKYISGGIVNVAQGKSVFVSSTYKDADPSKAVDGDTRTYYPHVMHTATGQSAAFWTVDLQVVMQDPTVKIYFRTDLKNRRNGVRLYTSLAAFSSYPGGQSCKTFSGASIPDIVSKTCFGKWRHLMVYTNRDNDNGAGPMLDFAEVEVLGCDGTYGTNCDKFCHSRHCAFASSSCYRYTGKCSGGCQTGWARQDCTACTSGSYGTNCNKSCLSRHCTVSSASCDRFTGKCPGGCKAGWAGIDCKEDCGNGTDGLNCDKVCASRQCFVTSTSCDRYSGRCPLERCNAGWRGTDCSKTCSSGYYGTNCDRRCSLRQCADAQSSCDHVTGACSGGDCRSGWMGIDCRRTCSRNGHRTNCFFGTNCNKSCESRQCDVAPVSCDRYTGVCPPGGCKPGWIGNDCLRACENGSYGTECVKSCSERQCKTSSSSCDHERGRCPGGCRDGWRGVDCRNVCPLGTFGQGCISCSERHCQGESDCPVDGTCSGGCQDGWMLNNCTQECPIGTFGQGCMTCSERHCLGQSRCRGNGTCSGGCQNGWMLDNCTQICSNDTYGPGCSSICGNCTDDDTCDHVTGKCPGDCKTGWRGCLCNQRINAYENNAMDNDISRTKKTALTNGEKGTINPEVTSRPQNSQPAEQVDEGVYVYIDTGDSPTTTMSQSTAPQQSQVLTDPDSNPVYDVIHDPVRLSNSDYYNGNEDMVREIPVGDLEATVMQIKTTGGFGSQFKCLPNGFSAPYGDSRKTENVGKNTFTGYYPYDHNRVRLSLLPDVPGSDYINASLMHSCDQKKAYIAAQAPNKQTVGDFWIMIWEHRCVRVIMLTNLIENRKVKCHQYWPDEEVLKTGHFRVEVKVTDVRANYTIRYLELTSEVSGECRSVEQYHFTSWLHHSFPNILALVNFIWMIREREGQIAENKSGPHQNQSSCRKQGTVILDGPLVVHCSAGVGRTGTYIAVDSLLDQARTKGLVDVLGYVSAMREQRKNMIQTKEQYECVFQCLVEMTKFGNTRMDLEKFTTSYTSRGMDSMVDRKTLRELTQMMATENHNDNPSQYQVLMDGNKDFFFIGCPTLRLLQGYLLTVVPHARIDKLLWKLVKENDAHNVIVTSQLQQDVEKLHDFAQECVQMTTASNIYANLHPTVTTTCLSTSTA